METDLKSLRDFLFRGLTFEAEAEKFRSAGISVGADISITEEALLVDALAPFSVVSRNAALQMARVYAVVFCFENALRELIRESMNEKHGPTWWTSVPARVQKMAESRQADAEKKSWLSADKRELLSFADFGDLASIIDSNWGVFESLIPSQHWLRQRMDELELARNFIAHNRLLDDSEFQRIYMYINDWNRQIGL